MITITISVLNPTRMKLNVNIRADSYACPAIRCDANLYQFFYSVAESWLMNESECVSFGWWVIAIVYWLFERILSLLLESKCVDCWAKFSSCFMSFNISLTAVLFVIYSTVCIGVIELILFMLDPLILYSRLLSLIFLIHYNGTFPCCRIFFS